MKKERQLGFRDLRPDTAATKAAIQKNRHPISLLLDRMDDPRNIGGIFRLADAALIEHIYFFGSPKKINDKSKRISRQTIDLVPHSFIHDLEEVKQLKLEAELVALEYTDQSMLYTEYLPSKKTILLIGNEQSGVSQELLDLSDSSIHLPMYGMNTSMNVMCAASIAVYSSLERLGLSRDFG